MNKLYPKYYKRAVFNLKGGHDWLHQRKVKVGLSVVICGNLWNIEMEFLDIGQNETKFIS